jgi:hypothetical protein
MAMIKIPYASGFASIDVSGVYEVDASSAPAMVLKTDTPVSSGNVLGITLTFDASSFNSADGPAMEAAILEAAQNPGSCDVYELADGSGLAADSSLTIGSVSE